MATIVKTRSGKWKAMIRRKGFPTAIRTFRVQRDAADWARTAEDEMVRGVFVDRRTAVQLMFSDALDSYLERVTKRKKASTQRAERLRAEALRTVFGKYSLAAITPRVVAKYRDDRLGAGRKPNTVRLDLALLGHIYTVAIKEWEVGLPQNPVHAIRRPAPGAPRVRRLSDAEEVNLSEELRRHSNPMVRWIFEIAIETTMRASEIAGLHLHEVDLERRALFLSDSKNGEPRTVPLSERACQLFAVAIKNPLRPKDCTLIFFGEPGRGGKRRPYNFNSAWNRGKKRANVTDLHFQDLRHEGISRLVEGGLPDQKVAAISGHKSMQMLKRYTHLRNENLVDDVDSAQQMRKTRKQQRAKARENEQSRDAKTSDPTSNNPPANGSHTDSDAGLN